MYGADPAVLARTFIDDGATRLHVVDLDAARGQPSRESAETVARIVNVSVASRCGVDVGGGIRSVDTAMRWLESGASFVVISSLAAREPELAAAICAAANGRVLLGLDVRAGVARVQGWTACAAAGATGVLVGRAVHEGMIDLGNALATFTNPN